MTTQMCGMCRDNLPVVLVVDHKDRLARRLGQSPSGLPLCFNCLGRNLAVKALMRSTNLAISRLPHLEPLDPGAYETVPPQGIPTAHCGGCGGVTATLYTVVGDTWTSLPESLCEVCLGKLLARALLSLEQTEYPISVTLAGLQPPEPELTSWSGTMLGPKPASVDFQATGHYAGSIVCPHCDTVLGKVGTRGQEITVVTKTPAISGYASAPAGEASKLRFLKYVTFGPRQRTNVQTVAMCWKGHDGLGIDYELCREIVAAAEQKGRPVRRPAVQLAPAPSATIETNTNSEP